ncbi:acyl-CoA dehydratase activase-related protein [Syntrophomonas erecta]
MSKIGIPRALAYYLYFPFWNVFFSELGHEVIVSSPTTRVIMDRGIEEAVNDACIPIKIYHGHVVDLMNKVDYIFCPRLVSMRKHGDFGTETFCPKFLGLPDMVRLGIKSLPSIIDTRIDLKKGKDELANICQEIAQQLNNTINEASRAYHQAVKTEQNFQKILEAGHTPLEAMDIMSGQDHKVDHVERYDAKIAVVGYPYALYDEYVNVGLLKLLKKQNVKVFTQDMLSDQLMNRQARTLPKSMFWYFSNRVVYGGLHYLARKDIDGLIHVTAFACGPDSMVDRLLEIESRRRGPKPYLSIAIDEHTGEAGVRTRIEAFLDMLRYRRDKL